LNPRTKRLLERTIVMSGIAALSRRRHSRGVLILAYHNVLPVGADPMGDCSLHLPAGRFVEQLDVLAETHQVIPLTSVAAPPTGDRPRVVITFDDAYAGALTTAIPELVRRHMPATVFVAPALLGGYTWWDRVADPKLASVPPAERELALDELWGDGEAILRDTRFPHRTSPVPSLRIATEAEVQAVAELPSITIGSHTWSHRSMARLGEDTAADELERSMKWLRERFASFVPWVSYPYGLFSEKTTGLAARLGYSGGLRIDGGWLRAGSHVNSFSLPRYNVPAGLSTEGFRIRLAGLLSRV
jgi:peptidoglycan/xylan/chitin deacetylase (PgdA/CDA1 family)